MARPRRILHPGAWYHLTARGIERRGLFRDDRDRAHFLELLEELVARFDVALHALVLVPRYFPWLGGFLVRHWIPSAGGKMARWTTTDFGPRPPLRSLSSHH